MDGLHYNYISLNCAWCGSAVCWSNGHIENNYKNINIYNEVSFVRSFVRGLTVHELADTAWQLSERLEMTRLSRGLCRKYRVIRNDCRGFNNLPPRAPHETPCDFFLWGYVKDQVYVPPLPASIPELKVRIWTTTETITADMLQTVWNELDYRVDVCRITKGAHIEHL